MNLDAPFQHYQPSPRPFPSVLPTLEYSPGALVRKVHSSGNVTYHDQEYRISKGLIGETVELRPTEKDGLLDVYFGTIKVRRIDISRKP